MSEEQRNVPAWRRVAVVMGWIALTIAVLMIGTYVYVRYHYTSELEKILAELDEKDPTWRWEKWLESRPPLEPAANSANYLIAIAKAIPRNWPDQKQQETFRELQPNETLDAPRREALAAILAMPPIPRLREEARQLVRYPKGRIDVEMKELPIGTLLPNHQNVREVAQLLSLDALDLALQGKYDEALASCEACLMLSRVMDEDPFLIGQLIRIAVVAISNGMIQRTLSLGEASDAALARMQKAVEHQMTDLRILHSLRMERWSIHQTMVYITQGKATAEEFALFGGEKSSIPGWNYVQAVLGREVARREHPSLLKTMNRVVDIAQLPLPEQIDAEIEFDKGLARSGGPFTRLLLPAMSKVNSAARRNVCAARAMHALLAVERYRLRHGKWPGALAECVPEFLEKEPLDPIDEKPLRYKILPDGVVVYSIGNNRTDDGGDLTNWQKDFGYRLWNKDKRAVMPPPLPKEEKEEEQEPVDPGEQKVP
jgi:hypothetical protein